MGNRSLGQPWRSVLLIDCCRSILTIAILLGSSAWGSRAAAQVFGPPAALNPNAATDSGDDFSPQVSTDGAGNWLAVWDSADSLGATLGSDSDILYSTRSIRPHSALGYQPPALEIIVPGEELPMRTGARKMGMGRRSE